MKRDCNTCRYRDCWEYGTTCGNCTNRDKWTAFSNADRIRAMTDKELAHLLGGSSMTCNNCLAHSDACEIEYNNLADMPTCEQIWLDWLKQEAYSESSR